MSDSDNSEGESRDVTIDGVEQEPYEVTNRASLNTFTKEEVPKRGSGRLNESTISQLFTSYECNTTIDENDAEYEEEGLSKVVIYYFPDQTKLYKIEMSVSRQKTLQTVLHESLKLFNDQLSPDKQELLDVDNPDQYKFKPAKANGYPDFDFPALGLHGLVGSTGFLKLALVGDRPNFSSNPRKESLNKSINRVPTLDRSSVYHAMDDHEKYEEEDDDEDDFEYIYDDNGNLIHRKRKSKGLCGKMRKMLCIS